MTRETLIEVMARAMFEDGWSLDPRHPDKEEVWLSEASDWLSNATAALLALEAAGVRMVPERPTRECDWKVPTKKSGTCDEGLCRRCTYVPAPEKDLCPKHAAEWEARRA